MTISHASRLTIAGNVKKYDIADDANQTHPVTESIPVPYSNHLSQGIIRTWRVVVQDSEDTAYQTLAQDAEFMTELRSDYARLRRRGRDTISD